MPARCLLIVAAISLTLVPEHGAFGQAKVNPKLPKVDPKAKGPNGPHQWDWQTFVKETSVMNPQGQIEAVQKKMRQVNPAFRDFYFVKVENGAVARVALDTYDIIDIAALRAFEQLIELHIVGNTGSGALKDISPLKGLRLGFLDVSYNPELGDVSVVKGMPLQTFRCDVTAVASLTPLSDCQTLEVLQTSDNKVTSLAPLKGLKLKSLKCSKNYVTTPAITDLSPLQGMMLTTLHADNVAAKDYTMLRPMPVEDLSLAGAPIVDFTIIKDMPLKSLDLSRTNFNDSHARLLAGKGVETLKLSGTQVRDLAFVKDLPVKELDVSRCAQLRDLSPLKDVKIERLNVSGTAIKDIKPLEGMPLTGLVCSDTNVVSLEPLKGSKLSSLDVSWQAKGGASPLADLGPLEGVPLQTLSCQNTQIKDLKALAKSPLEKLYIQNTPIRDLSPLAGTPLSYLNCKNTKVTDYSALKGAENLSTLDCDAKLPRDKAGLKQIKSLRVLNGQNAQNILN